jgi:hypothetical protein
MSSPTLGLFRHRLVPTRLAEIFEARRKRSNFRLFL